MTTATLTRETVAPGKLLSAAAIGGVVAAVVNLALFFILPALLNSLLRVRTPQATELEPLPFIAVIMASIVPAFVGAGLLWLLNRFTARPVTIFTVIAVIVTLLSLATPFQLGISTTEAIILVLMHIVAGAVITYFLVTRSR
ncbi:MAG: DUF6069 family protein [Chloroflexota bacterium]|nr:DUF6069 family protein [Chloroflexota bacterium]